MLFSQKFFYNQVDGITRAAFIIGFFSLASKILGLVRDRILAGAFGAGDTLDMYYAAFRIPDTIFNLLIIGALSASFIPILSGYYYKKDNARFFKAANNVLNLFLAAIIAASIVIFFFMPQLLKLVVPGWTGEKFDTTVALTRAMLLSPIFLTLSSVAGGVLQSTKRFLVYAAAPVGYNIGIIIGAVFLVQFWGVYGLAAGVILGAILYFLFQWPVIKSLGYSYKFSFDYKDPDVRKIFRLMLPRTLSLGVGQINLFVITSVASTLAAGSLTVFNFATSIQNIFFGLIGISFAVAVFPALSSYLAAGQREKFTASFSQAFREIIFFIVPASAYLIIFRSEIVNLIFSVGKFDAFSAIITEQTLLFFALGLTAQSLISLVVRTFWALGDTKTPFYTSLFGMVVNAVAAVWASRNYGVAGLAIAFTLTNTVDFILLFLLLRRQSASLDEAKIYRSFFKILFATTIGIMVVWYLIGFAPLVGVGKLLILFRLLLGTIIFTGSFLLAGWLVKTKEIFIFTDALKRRFGKKEAVYPVKSREAGVAGRLFNGVNVEEIIDQK